MLPQSESPPSVRWGAFEMLLTVAAVLGGVAVGAWIFYIARRSSGGGSAPLALAPPVLGASMQDRVAQIRSYVEVASRATSPATGLTNASYALALLDDALVQAADEMVRLCDPDKLRRLILRLQDRHGSALDAGGRQQHALAPPS